MSICTAPTFKLKELNNLFIEMTSKNCNQRCKSCFIDFPINKNVKDFIPVDKVKECLNDTKNENLYCIYLTGAEPMTHPDFNSILTLCLKRCNVCICTNGSYLNEKKVRFLKKVEDEGVNQIFIKLTLTHFDELENDKARYRGNYRQTISALKNLSHYNFNSVLSIQNYYNISESEIYKEFNSIFQLNEIINTDIQINISYPNSNENIDYVEKCDWTDCIRGRVITKNGVYACPFLANDYRGRMGTSCKDYSTNITAETDYCLTCISNKKMMFGIG